MIWLQLSILLLALVQLGILLQVVRTQRSVERSIRSIPQLKKKTIPRPVASNSSIPSYQGMRQGRAAHVINPKSPLELEREADERLRKQSLVQKTIQQQRN
jgi:hypothetical protein